MTRSRLVWLMLGATALMSVLALVLTLPAAPETLQVTTPPTTVVGAYHIHTDRSDGSGSVDEVAAAAARAGLRFVIVTDHGDATRAPDPPSYRQGVLVIDAVEISVREGHVVALGLREGSAYPLGGEARDVVEDVHRMGGWTVAAHPDSPKPDLRWRGRATDAIEWINADSEWRDEKPLRILQAVAHAFLRPEGAIAALFSRPQSTFRRWDNWARTGHVPGFAAVDAHARIGVDEASEPRRDRTLLARPSYEDMFRTLVQAVWLDAPLTGDAAPDADRILAALRSGRTYSAVTAIARPAVLEVETTGGRLVASVPGAPQAEIAISRGGREVAVAPARAAVDTAAPGLYRIDVRWPGVSVPWMVSAPVFVPPPADRTPPAPQDLPPAPGERLVAIPAQGPWRVEQHPASRGEWTAAAGATQFTYTLGPGRGTSQYTALVHGLDPSDSFDEVRLTVSADRPMRFSVQVRMAGPAGGERWVRSVYADPQPREVRLRLEDFEPAEPGITRRPIAARLESLLFVVDGPHTPPGSSGRLVLSSIALRAPIQPGLTSER